MFLMVFTLIEPDERREAASREANRERNKSDQAEPCEQVRDSEVNCRHGSSTRDVKQQLNREKYTVRDEHPADNMLIPKESFYICEAREPGASEMRYETRRMFWELREDRVHNVPVTSKGLKQWS